MNCIDFLCECSKTHEYKHKTLTQVITSSHSLSMYTTSQLVSGIPSMSMSPSTTADLSSPSCNAPSVMNPVIFVVLSLSLATMVSSVIIIVILAWKLNSKPSECEN